MYTTVICRAIGMIRIVSDGCRLLEVKAGRWDMKENCGGCEFNDLAVSEIDEYLKGERTDFDLPFFPEGSDFDKDIWKAVCRIPYGHTLTYSELAAFSGHPGACRAAGRALGRNRLLLVIPCHRVVGKRNLGGFAAGSDVKRYLLDLEAEGRQ